MRTFFLIFAIQFLSVCWARSGTSQLRTDNKRLILTPPISKKIRDFDLKFQIWKTKDYMPSVKQYYKFSKKQNLSSVVDDFDGDGVNDVILQGRNSKEDLILAILSKTQNVLLIDKFPLTDPSKNWMVVPDVKNNSTKKEYGLWVYLTHVPVGKKSSPYEKKKLDLKTAAFELQYFEKASVLYYFDGKKFSKFTTGD